MVQQEVVVVEQEVAEQEVVVVDEVVKEVGMVKKKGKVQCTECKKVGFHLFSSTIQ